MNSDYISFEAPSLLSVGGNNEQDPEEDQGEGVNADDDAAGEEKTLRDLLPRFRSEFVPPRRAPQGGSERIENRRGWFGRRRQRDRASFNENHLRRGESEYSVICELFVARWLRQRRMLSHICDGISSFDENGDDGEKQRELKLELLGNLLSHGGYRMFQGRRYGISDRSFGRLLYLYDRAFVFDLTGCLRRYCCREMRDGIRTSRTVTALGVHFHDYYDYYRTLPRGRYVRLDEYYRTIGFLKDVLVKCVVLNAPCMQTLDLHADRDSLLVLIPALQSMQHLKNLSLHVSSYHLGTTAFCLDPLICAVAGGVVVEEQGSKKTIHNTPSLEEFRLRIDSPRDCYLNDDEIFVRLLNRPALKGLKLYDLLEPRHVHLIERHLSRHPNIEELVIDCLKIGVEPRLVSPEDCIALEDMTNCLVRLARANHNLKKIVFCTHAMRLLSINRRMREVQRELHDIQGKVRQGLHEVEMWTALNRNGLKNFLVGSCNDPSWSRPQCVDFLARIVARDPLVVGGGGYHPDILEMLFLSIRMRPDLCQQQQSEREDEQQWEKEESNTQRLASCSAFCLPFRCFQKAIRTFTNRRRRLPREVSRGI